MYLDDPSQDSSILAPSSGTFCLPAAHQAVDLQQSSEKYLICILLQQVTGKDVLPATFKRIGLSKIAPRTGYGERIFQASQPEKDMSYWNWDEETQRGTIRII